MKVNRRRPGKKVVEDIASIEILDEDGYHVGIIDFDLGYTERPRIRICGWTAGGPEIKTRVGNAKIWTTVYKPKPEVPEG